MGTIINDHGGGAQSTYNGLAFEQATSLDEAFSSKGYVVVKHEVFGPDTFQQPIGISAPKHLIYSHFLTPNGIDFEQYNSKKWLPDEAFINYETKTAYIIEKKFQSGRGSADEKLPNCHFKKLEYEKLFHPIGYQVEFLYLLSDWFLQPKYRDTLEYITMMGCHYYYNELPLTALGIKKDSY